MQAAVAAATAAEGGNGLLEGKLRPDKPTPTSTPTPAALYRDDGHIGKQKPASWRAMQLQAAQREVQRTLHRSGKSRQRCWSSPYSKDPANASA